MKTLVGHQFRKYVRELRLALIAWWALLALDLWSSLGVGAPLAVPAGNSPAGASSPFLEGAAYLLVFIIPLILGWTDSTAVPDAFIKSRPIPVSAVWKAKAWWLLLLIVLPALVQGVLFSLLMGLGLKHAAWLSLDRLVFLLPILAIMVCLGGLAPSLPKLGAMTAFLWLGTHAGIMLYIGIRYLVAGEASMERMFAQPGVAMSRILVVLYVGTAAFVFALWRQIRGGTSMRRNLTVYAGCLGLGILILEVFPVNFLRPRAPAFDTPSFDPSAIKVHLEKTGASIDVSSVNEQTGEKSYRINAPIRLIGLPAGFRCYPVAWRAVLWKGNDAIAEYRMQPVARQRDGFGIRYENEIPYEGLKALLDGIGPEATIVGSWRTDIRRFVPTYWPNKTLESVLDQALDLTAEMDLHCFAMRKVARIPLAPGGQFCDEDLRFRILCAPVKMESESPLDS